MGWAGPTGVQALCDGGGVDQVALTQATCDVGVDVTEFDLPRQHVGVLQPERQRGQKGGGAEVQFEKKPKHFLQALHFPSSRSRFRSWSDVEQVELAQLDSRFKFYRITSHLVAENLSRVKTFFKRSKVNSFLLTDL